MFFSGPIGLPQKGLIVFSSILDLSAEREVAHFCFLIGDMHAPDRNVRAVIDGTF